MKKTAVLITNLGSPDSYQVSDVKAYLKEFLMDEKVIDIPFFLRYVLINGIIVPFRASKSAERYQSIWTENGSPLICITKELQTKLHQEIDLPVFMCMRYGNPSPTNALKEISKSIPDLDELILLPLYPHYAMSSFETAVDHVKSAFKEGGYSFILSVIPPFYKHAKFINALVKSIEPFLDNPFDKILFSYHGIPERHVRKTDVTGKHCLANKDCCSIPSEAHPFCYRHQVIETTNLVAQALHLEKHQYDFAFQSRLGKEKWLQPDTAKVIENYPSQGIKNLLIICPAFVSDCLETLEEIEVEGRDVFIKAGGESYTMIPCLNTNKEWISAIADILETKL